MKKSLIVAALALTAAACGGSSKKTTAAGATFACNFPAPDSMCMEFSGPAAAVSAAYGSTQCTTDGGTVVSACSATARAGRCTVTDPQAQLTLVYHIYTASPDNATACGQLGGTWTAG
jgi:hypothetical protein